jgi:flavorubredoxin
MVRQIVDDLYMIQEPYELPNDVYEAARPDWYELGSEITVFNNAYLIQGEQTLLFDTLSPYSTDDVLAELQAVLGDDELDYLAISHPENPHAGNTFAILDRYPDATLVGPKYSTRHEVYYLEDSKKVEHGDRIDLGGYEVEFLEPAFPDHPVHVWMRERKTETLFTIDWLGSIHLDSHKEKFADEVDGGVDVQQLVDFTSQALFWHRYADPERLHAVIDNLIEAFDPEIVAPAHGFVYREEPIEAMESMKAVAAEIATSDGERGAL